METSNNEKNQVMQVRQPEIDIIKGASNTDQIAAMQANASQDQNGKQPDTANILAVENGEGNQSANGTDDEQNRENPATRGI